MQPKFFSLGLFGLAVVSGAMVLAVAPGKAQPAQSTAAAPAESAMHEEVTVYAPYVVRRKVINPMMSKTSSTGLELVSVSRSVSFRDLDLSRPADVTTLENRVHQAAADACTEIDKRFPKTKFTPVPENQDCVGNAVSEAMITVKQLEAAATKS